MSKTSGMRSKRISHGVALVGVVVLLTGLACPAAFSQTVQKNEDGTVEAYDAGDTSGGASAEGYGDGGSVGGGSGNYTGVVNGVHYRPGTTPYTRKSGNMTVRRNSDGSIEVSEPEEVHHFTYGGDGAPVRKASRGKKRTATKTATKTAVKTTATKKKAK